jgi:hypothetical protein
MMHTALPALFALLLMAAAKKPIKTGTSSGHITNLKQSFWRLLISMKKHNRTAHLALFYTELIEANSEVVD